MVSFCSVVRFLLIPALVQSAPTLLPSASLSPVPHRPRATTACFVVGNASLPAEVQASVDSIIDTVTCDPSSTTIGTVPDVTSGNTSFSSINFAESEETPLGFALSMFASETPLANSDLPLFGERLDVYLATEAGLRSTGGSLAIKIPKFFLSFQMARIKTAQGVEITAAGQTVEHLLGKVLSNTKGESQAARDQVTALAGVLA